MQGADASQGPGWWQASDGKWYPPEAQPGTAPTTPPVTPSTMPAGGGAGPSFSGGVEGEPFFKRFFDISMTTFVTPSIIKVLFVISIAVTSLLALLYFILGVFVANESLLGGLFFILLVPVFWLLGIIYWRVLLELVIVLFRIERNTRSTRNDS
jgi:uncharacterized membrane protein